MALSRNRRFREIWDHGTPAGTRKAEKLFASSSASPPRPPPLQVRPQPPEPPPLDDSRTGSNPPRTTTSLLALVSGRHQLGKIKPSREKNQKKTTNPLIRNVTVLDPSLGKNNFWDGGFSSALTQLVSRSTRRRYAPVPQADCVTPGSCGTSGRPEEARLCRCRSWKVCSPVEDVC